MLDRLLLVYEAGLGKFTAREDFDPTIIANTAKTVRDFVEDYHEKLEEEQVFPRLKAAGQETVLVDTLLAQHQRGRKLTSAILQFAPGSRADENDRQKLTDAIQAFIRMYRPHAAREDTVLFPRLRKIVSPHEYDAIGEDFEKQEKKRFGEDGFQKTVARVAKLEQQIGIADLAQFTPA